MHFQIIKGSDTLLGIIATPKVRSEGILYTVFADHTFGECVIKFYLYANSDGVPIGRSRSSGFAKIYLISFRLLAK